MLLGSCRAVKNTDVEPGFDQLVISYCKPNAAKVRNDIFCFINDIATFDATVYQALQANTVFLCSTDDHIDCTYANYHSPSERKG